jgi:hypothetical protein
MPKHYLHHPDGSVTIEDTRTVEGTRAEHLDRIRTACTASILAVAPEHTQRNAALGIVPIEPIVEAISARRDLYHTLQASILAVTWDGQEATRTAACDAIEAVQWEEP